MLKYEFIICWDDRTWDDCHFLYVDNNNLKPDEGWDDYALNCYIERLQKREDVVVFVGVYNVEEVVEDEAEEIFADTSEEVI